MRFTEFHLRFVFGILRSTHSTACKYVHRKCAKKAEQLQLFTFFLRQIICQQQTRTINVWNIFLFFFWYWNRIVCSERRGAHFRALAFIIPNYTANVLT